MLLGRSLRRENGVALGWPGSRIAVRARGDVRVRLTETSGEPSVWGVYVGDDPRPPLVVGAGADEHSIRVGDEDTLVLVRRSEGGETLFRGFAAEVAPCPRSSVRIEIVGDSIAAGFGLPRGAEQTFGSRLARDAGADHHVVAASGKGVSRNHQRGDATTMHALYTRALPGDVAPWDFGAFEPTTIVVYLWTNDFLGDDRREPDDASFTGAYRRLLGIIRDNNLRARVVCVVPASVLRSRERVLSGITRAAREMRDPDVVVAAPRAASPAELDGALGHPGPAFHARLAADLTPFMEPRLVLE